MPLEEVKPIDDEITVKVARDLDKEFIANRKVVDEPSALKETAKSPAVDLGPSSKVLFDKELRAKFA